MSRFMNYIRRHKLKFEYYIAIRLLQKYSTGDKVEAIIIYCYK